MVRQQEEVPARLVAAAAAAPGARSTPAAAARLGCRPRPRRIGRCYCRRQYPQEEEDGQGLGTTARHQHPDTHPRRWLLFRQLPQIRTPHLQRRPIREYIYI